ncbi:MAG: hypothetical protein AAFV95_23400 [Bacteroidota bacterium]
MYISIVLFLFLEEVLHQLGQHLGIVCQSENCCSTRRNLFEKNLASKTFFDASGAVIVAALQSFRNQKCKVEKLLIEGFEYANICKYKVYTFR